MMRPLAALALPFRRALSVMKAFSGRESLSIRTNGLTSRFFWPFSCAFANRMAVTSSVLTRGFVENFLE